MPIDFSHLPDSWRGADVQIFNRPCTVTNLQWETWRKPTGKTMCFIFCVGGGGGGGGGFTGASGSRGGGGSGGSSGTTRILVPIFLMRDVLYVQVGQGGQGTVSGGGTAGSGVLSFVSIVPDNTTSNVVAMSGAVAAVGGVTGISGAGGAGGAAGTIAVIASQPQAGLGFTNFIAGQIGVAGGTGNAAGSAISISITSVLTQAGSGGGGTNTVDQTGGPFTGITDSLISESRPSTPAAGSNAGSGGLQLWSNSTIFFSFGGGGGSSSTAGVGGGGGNGSYGAGGGGGGAGTTGGRGGNGGSGFVLMVSF